jgi:RNA-binding protein
VAQALTGKQRRHLRALAHPLKPVVRIGSAGLAPGVIEEISRALETHELIKVRVAKESPEEPDALVEPLEAGARAVVAQVIGRTLVVYRRRQKAPKIQLPRAEREK